MTTAPKGPGRRSGGHRSAHTGSSGGSSGGNVKKVKHYKTSYRTFQRQIRHYKRTHPQKKGLVLLQSGEEVEFGRVKPYARYEKPRLVIDHHLDLAALPAPPAVVDRASEVSSWPMYGNDTKPDCTFAAIGHEIQAWTAYAGTEVTLQDSSIAEAFAATGPLDQGRNVQDVLGYWRKTGVGGHKIGGFAQLGSIDNLTLAKQCLQIFGTVYLGIQVPQSAMDQFQAGEPWTFTGDANIVGGHAIPVQYWETDAFGEIEVVTWGQRQRMTRGFWHNYVEEAWVAFSPDWLEANGDAPSAYNLPQLRSAFTDLTGDPASF